ncbi:MAG TPA: hypothetical protein VMS40_00965, partial [Vicinamibacterales bacterium]|nr:hypothetical protein [Vicinamibacterales bacterium]
MQQRRVRLGDVLDDYCPRERRITNHAVVAMIEDDVKQTRCTTCDAEHEYKHAKMPAPRRKKPGTAGATLVPAEATTESQALISGDETVEEMLDDTPDLLPPTLEAAKEPEAAETVDVVDADEPQEAVPEDEWPVHRPLIRATLPRPEGQTPERKPTDFTIRQNGGRFDGQQRNGNNKSRGHRQGHHAQGQGQGQGQGPSRFGGTRQGSGFGSSRQGGQQGGGNQQRQGNRPGASPGQRGGRPGPGGGNRPGQGR